MSATSGLERIAVVVPQSDPGMHAVLQGIIKYVERSEQLWVEIYSDHHAALRAAEAWQPSGVIASLSTPALGHWALQLGVPVVNMSSALEVAGIPHVGVNDENVGELAASDFIEHGFRNVAFVGVANHRGSMRREQGFRKRMATVGVEQIPATVIDDTSGGAAPGHAPSPQLMRWLKMLPSPLAVFCCDDLCARLVGQAGRAAEIEQPVQLAIMGCGDDDILCRINVPPLSSVTLPLELVGYEAAALLERLIAHEKPPAQPVQVPVSSVSRRKSTNTVPIPDHDVAEALRFIQAHAGEWIGVPEILLAVPINRRSLERKFRQYLGRSPLEEIRRLRLELAKKLLATTDLSMPIVARQSGFSEAKQLSLVFHAMVGVTPTTYRRQFRVPADGAAEKTRDQAGNNQGTAQATPA